MTTTQAQPITSEWGSDRVDLGAYLGRIAYDGPLASGIDALRGLHRAHAATIPFENLDILLGRPIPLDIDSLQDKLVGRPRGGYCYEHNLLFTQAGSVRIGSDKLQPRSHALLRVRADGEDWLADVGFGGEGILEPIPLVPGTTARQAGWTYRLDREPGGVWVLRSLHPDRASPTTTSTMASTTTRPPRAPPRRSSSESSSSARASRLGTRSPEVISPPLALAGSAHSAR